MSETVLYSNGDLSDAEITHSGLLTRTLMCPYCGSLVQLKYDEEQSMYILSSNCRTCNRTILYLDTIPIVGELQKENQYLSDELSQYYRKEIESNVQQMCGGDSPWETSDGKQFDWVDYLVTDSTTLSTDDEHAEAIQQAYQAAIKHECEIFLTTLHERLSLEGRDRSVQVYV